MRIIMIDVIFPVSQLECVYDTRYIIELLIYKEVRKKVKVSVGENVDVINTVDVIISEENEEEKELVMNDDDKVFVIEGIELEIEVKVSVGENVDVINSVDVTISEENEEE